MTMCALRLIQAKLLNLFSVYVVMHLVCVIRIHSNIFSYFSFWLPAIKL